MALALTVLSLSACAATTQPSDPQTIRVLTYNIHTGIGTDRKLDLPRIANIIKGCNADLVALQEVDRNTRRTKQIDTPAELARLTGMHAAFGKALDFSGGEYGIAILSRHPIDDATTHALPSSPKREPRIALSVRVRLPDGLSLRFVCTHLDHTAEGDGPQQMRELSKLFGQHTGPVILAGDFNKDPDHPAMLELAQTWADAFGPAAPPTYPSTRPSTKIDYILFRRTDGWRVVEAAVINEEVASDHRPVLAVLERKRK